MADERLFELPDADPPRFADLDDGDAGADDEGDLGRSPEGGPDPRRRARPIDRIARGTAPGFAVDIPLALLYPLRAWELAWDDAQRAELAGTSDGERWVRMVADALGRDMEADDYRPAEQRHYDFAQDWQRTFGGILDLAAERARRRDLAAYRAAVADNLKRELGEAWTAARAAAILGEDGAGHPAGMPRAREAASDA